jgi:hypothetical protein
MNSRLLSIAAAYSTPGGRKYAEYSGYAVNAAMLWHALRARGVEDQLIGRALESVTGRN